MDLKYLFEGFDFDADGMTADDEVIQEIKDSVMTTISPDAFSHYDVDPAEIMGKDSLKYWNEYVGASKHAYVLISKALKEKYGWNNQVETYYHCGLDQIMENSGDFEMPVMTRTDSGETFVFTNKETGQNFMAFGHLGYDKVVLSSDKLYKGAEYFKKLINVDTRMFEKLGM